MRRDWLITRSYRLAILFDIAFGVLNLAVIFYISRTFAGVEPAALEEAPSYFAFAAVGVAVGLVIQASSAAIGSKVREEQLTGTLEALAAQPLSPTELCLGLVGFPYLFALVRALGYLAIAAAVMGLDVSDANWVGLVTVLLATGIAFVAIGVLSGAVVLVMKRGETLVGTAVFAMTLLSGSVFPRSVLPGWLEWIGGLIPVRFAFDGVRAALFTGSGWGAHVVTLTVFGLIGLPVAIWTFARALRLAQRAGSLGQY